MALTFDTTKVKDSRELWNEDETDLIPIHKGVVFATMAVDMGEITEANAPEFYARITVWTKLYGALVTDGDGKDRPFTPWDIQRMIGLHTNVRNLTRVQWFNRVKRELGFDMDSRVREYKRDIKESEVKA